MNVVKYRPRISIFLSISKTFCFVISSFLRKKEFWVFFGDYGFFQFLRLFSIKGVKQFLMIHSFDMLILIALKAWFNEFPHFIPYKWMQYWRNVTLPLWLLCRMFSVQFFFDLFFFSLMCFVVVCFHLIDFNAVLYSFRFIRLTSNKGYWWQRTRRPRAHSNSTAKWPKNINNGARSIGWIWFEENCTCL